MAEVHLPGDLDEAGVRGAPEVVIETKKEKRAENDQRREPEEERIFTTKAQRHEAKESGSPYAWFGFRRNEIYLIHLSAIRLNPKATKP
jgi:hypothetical protein